jgi:hypothetical protein
MNIRKRLSQLWKDEGSELALVLLDQTVKDHELPDILNSEETDTTNLRYLGDISKPIFKKTWLIIESVLMDPELSTNPINTAIAASLIVGIAKKVSQPGALDEDADQNTFIVTNEWKLYVEEVKEDDSNATKH